MESDGDADAVDGAPAAFFYRNRFSSLPVQEDDGLQNAVIDATFPGIPPNQRYLLTR